MADNLMFAALVNRKRQRSVLVLGLLVLAGIGAFMVSLCVGDIWLWPTQWFSESAQLFVWQLRLPRSLAVLLVGASLAVCGAVMQVLFENPLAEPGLLGISNGAGVALVLAIVLGQGVLPHALMGFYAIVGALIITSIILIFAKNYLANAHLLLIGVALGIICSAIMTWAVYFSSSLDLRQLIYWMMGGFGGVDWRQKWLLLALLPVLLWLCCLGNVLNFMALGHLPARQIGVEWFFWRKLLVLAIGWLVGVSVALAGVIGFVGLVVPHILRLIGLTDQRYLLPGCALAGAGGVLMADVLARTLLSSAELPLGIVTATLGAPVFIWLLYRVKER